MTTAQRKKTEDHFATRVRASPILLTKPYSQRLAACPPIALTGTLKKTTIAIIVPADRKQDCVDIALYVCRSGILSNFQHVTLSQPELTVTVTVNHNPSPGTHGRYVLAAWPCYSSPKDAFVQSSKVTCSKPFIAKQNSQLTRSSSVCHGALWLLMKQAIYISVKNKLFQSNSCSNLAIESVSIITHLGDIKSHWSGLDSGLRTVCIWISIA